MILIIKRIGMAEFLILFRETLEMALIVGIVSTYLVKTNSHRHLKVVGTAVVTAIISSILLAFIFQSFMGGFSGFTEEVFEGVIMITASILLGSMVVWMAKNKGNATQLKDLTKQAINSKNAIYGIFAIIYLAVLREGIEIVLFLYSLMIKNGGVSILSSCMGSATAALIGYLMYRKGKQLPISKFFNYSSFLLIIIASGLLAHGVHELEEANIIPYNKSTSIIWDINPSLSEEQLAYNNTVEKHERIYPLFHEKGTIGSLAKAIFGYNGNPSKIEVLSWIVMTSTLLYLWRFYSNRRLL